MITLLTDFGLADHYVAAMKGVILTICPAAQIVDISHEIPPCAIGPAAYTLSQAWTCFPSGTIHVAVVDPGVGSSRRPIVAEAGGHFFVGPDNGVLGLALRAADKAAVRHVTAERYFRQPVSNTFHGRDIFAPVAAQLANGVSPAKFGRRIVDWVQAASIEPVQLGDGHWLGSVLSVDRFGNVVTNLKTGPTGFAAARQVEARIGGHVVRNVNKTYALEEPGLPFLLEGSGGFLEISITNGDAAAFLGAAPGMKFDIRIT